MKYRRLGKTGFDVSEISLGTWQVGGKWGSEFDAANAERIILKAIEGGVNFLDTADVYSDGLSEKAVAKAAKASGAKVRVATKCGRKISPHVSAGYTPQALRGYVEASLRNMGLETLDLIQLHCPPTEVYYRPEIFGLFETLKAEGKIRNLGVSVEKVEEAVKAVEYPNVTTVQIIFNMFRQRPADSFFSLARKRDVGIIVRVPLASGLLSGAYSRDTRFGENDHRTYNREGAAFDKGETFSGIPYEIGLAAVEELKRVFAAKAFGELPNLAPIALRWVLMFPEVSCVIPGASRPDQAESNLAAAVLKRLSGREMAAVREVYERLVKPRVHQLW